MEIDLLSMNNLAKTIFPHHDSPVAFEWDLTLDAEIEVFVVESMFKDLPLDLKRKVSFASFMLSPEEFSEIIKST